MSSNGDGDSSGLSDKKRIPEPLRAELNNIFGQCYYPDTVFFAFQDDMRKHVYIQLSNSENVKTCCKGLFEKFVQVGANTVIPIDGQSKDLLHSMMLNEELLSWKQDYKEEEIKVVYHIDEMVLPPGLQLESNAVDATNIQRAVPKSSTVGLQHIVLSSVPEPSDSSETDSTRSSSSSEMLGLEPKRKKLGKVCQEAKNVDLDIHTGNYRRDSKILCQVDILILVTVSNAASVAQHLGLIHLESVLSDVKNAQKYLMNSNAKTYKLAQTRISQLLMNGFSNILVTTNKTAWEKIRANVRAIVTESKFLQQFGSKRFRQAADYLVVVDDILSCIEAIGGILNKSLHCEVTTPIRYEVAKDKYSIINVPLTVVIPLYVIRYLTQLHIFRSKDRKDYNLQKLFQ